MLCGAHLQARSLVNAITPPLLAWYPIACSSADAPPNPATQAMLMIFPDPCAVIALPAACPTSNVPVYLRARALPHSSTVSSSTRPPPDTPALVLRRSIRPHSP